MKLGWLGVLFLAAACSQVFSPGTAPPSPAGTRIASAATLTPSATWPTATATLAPTPLPPSPLPSPAQPTPTPSATPVPVVQLMAVGDVMLGRSVGEQLKTDGPAVAFSGVQPALNSADLLVANLECVVSQLGEPQPKAYRFRAPSEAVEALALAGMDVVNLANNHSMDYGDVALADMRKQLAERDIATVGAGQNEAAAHAPVIVERNGVRVAFLSYVDVFVEGRTGFDTHTWTAGPNSPGVAWADPKRITADVQGAKLQAEVVVVLLHFGLESRSAVTPAQRAEAEAAIDAGAALVLGSHPHLLQPVEQYHGGLIAYSLGNFIFDGFTLPENYSAIFTASLTPSGLGEYNWIPVVIENGLPRLATNEEASVILAALR